MGSPTARDDSGRDHLDDSAVTPAPKAYGPPFQKLDVVELRAGVQQDDVRVDQDDVCVDGEAKIGREPNCAVSCAVVCGVALATSVTAGVLGSLCHPTGWAALAIASGSGGAVLLMLIGLRRISNK